jgi:sarcosine oxidase subunit gamma
VTSDFRSLLDPVHDAAGAHWERRGNYRVVRDFGETGPQRALAFGRLALIDLSPLPRLGIKGARVTDWLETQQLQFSAQANKALVQADGSLLGRLAPNEFLWLTDPACPGRDPGAEIPDNGRNCYSINRRDSHYWFALSGTQCASMLAKLCGVNFAYSSFQSGCIAQTQVAKTSAIVVRNDFGQTPLYHLLGDSSLVCYLWTCLLDAMGEFRGQILGVRALESSGQDVR